MVCNVRNICLHLTPTHCVNFRRLQRSNIDLWSALGEFYPGFIFFDGLGICWTMFFTARNICNAATMSALFVTQYCQVHFSGGGVVVLESTCSAPWVPFILPNQPVRNQWNYQEKMERHFSVKKQKFQENQATIYSSTEILTTFWQSRTGNENFWNWNDKDRPVKEDHLWR